MLLSSGAMDKWDTIKDNIYLPVLVFVFVFSIFLAWLMVSHSRVLDFSSEQSVPCGGVSARLPVGRGWDDSGGWQLAGGNQFVFVSRQQSGSAAAEVRWSYKYAWAGGDALEAVTEVVNSRGGKMIEGGRRESPAGQMEWAQVQTTARRGRQVMVFRDLFVGAVVLGDGQVLVLTVETSGDEYYAQELFKAVAGEFSYSEPACVDEAANVLGYFKARRFGDYVERGSGDEEFFLLKANEGADDSEAFGFYGQRIGEEADGSVRLDNVFYKAGRQGGYFVRGQFRCGSELDGFVWRSQQQGRGGGETEVVLEEEGIMTVRGVGATGQFAGRYRPGRSGVADAVLDMFIEEAVDEMAARMCVDVILRTGQVLRAIVEVERADGDDTEFDGQRVCERAVVRLAHEEGANVVYYFGCDGRLVGKEDDIGGERMVWVKRDKAEVLGEFEGFDELYEMK